MKATKKQISEELQRLASAAAGVGIVPDDGFCWHVEMGSKINGRAYWLHWERKETGALYRPGKLPEFLGLTLGEACQSLITMRAVLYACAAVAAKDSR